MNSISWDVGIISRPEEVSPYVEEACNASDTHKEALGFLPERAYREAAEQGKLFVAVIKTAGGPIYAGHLLHGGVFPQARIFQVFTAPGFRQKGIGRRLVEALVRRAESMQFMSIVAKVADDLAANKFWDRLFFEIVRTKPGGRTTGRQINVRVREVNTPQLFSLATAPKEPASLDLKLISRLFDTSPTYVLDLNIVHDLVKRRANVEEVGRIVRASFNNLVRLAVTEEFIRELERTSKPAPTDPILELALKLPRLRTPPAVLLDQIVSKLRPVVFPGKATAGKLRVQDHSDLVHLATAIHNEASGFITGDRAILRAREVLQSGYSIDVVGADEFADTVEPLDSGHTIEVQALSGDQILQGRPARAGDRSLLEAFLGLMRCPQTIAQDALRDVTGRSQRRMIVTVDGHIVAFGSWEIPTALRPQIQAFVCIDEDNPAVSQAADYLLDSVSRASFPDYPSQLSLHLLPGHVTTRRIAIAHGFRPSADESPNSTNLQKIALGTGITAGSWDSVCQKLKAGMGLQLPERIPSYHSLEQRILIKSPTGHEINISLGELETLLSPTLFCLPGRSGAMVPIRRNYAADLIGGARQLSLLASPEAVFLRDRVYFSNPRTLGVLTKGTPILFYESARKGGSASVTAAARIIRSDLVPRDEANQELLRRGVLDKRILKKICLSRTVLATTVDNIMPFKHPIGFARLRALSAIDGTNLVTARLLRSEQLIQIIDEGMVG